MQGSIYIHITDFIQHYHFDCKLYAEWFLSVVLCENVSRLPTEHYRERESLTCASCLTHSSSSGLSALAAGLEFIYTSRIKESLSLSCADSLEVESLTDMNANLLWMS